MAEQRNDAWERLRGHKGKEEDVVVYYNDSHKKPNYSLVRAVHFRLATFLDAVQLDLEFLSYALSAGVWLC